MNRRLLPTIATTLAAALSITLAACSNEGGIAGFTSTQNELLAYVPEDSPYVAANLEPLPRDFVESMFFRLQPALDAIQSELAAKRSELAERDISDDTGEAIALALLNELDGNMTPAGLESLGFSTSAHQVVYGMGPFPVIRVSLSNAQALRDTIGRIEANSGSEFPVLSHDGQSFWRLAEVESDGEVNGGLYLAIIEDSNGAHFAMSAFPSEIENEMLPSFLGQELPLSNSAADQLAEINRTYGYSPHGTAFLDVQRMFDHLSDPDSPLHASFDDHDRHALSDLSDVCRAEISELIAMVPRFVGGTTELSADAVGFQYRAELENSLASDLASLVANVPPVPAVTDRLLELSLGIRIGAARDFLITEATEWSLKQFECEDLRNINVRAEELLAKLNYPMPPLVNNFLGIRASITELPETQSDFDTAQGTFALHMDKPEMVVGMAKMFLPQMADIELTKGAAPVEIPQSILPLNGVTAFAAMSDEALGIAIGPGEENRLGEFLNASGNSDGTFFSVSYDMATYQERIDQITESAMRDYEYQSGEKYHSPINDAFREVFRNMAGRNSMSMSFDSEGLAIDNTMEFGD